MRQATDTTELTTGVARKVPCPICGGAVHLLAYPDKVHDGRCSGCGWFTRTEDERGELVSRAQRFGAQAMADELAELLVKKQSEHREKLEQLFAGFVADEASVAPFSEILRLRLRARAFEEVVWDLVALIHALDLDLPESLSRIQGIDTVAAPRGLHTRRARYAGGEP